MSRKIAAPKSPARKLTLVPLLIAAAAVAAFPAGAATGDSSITGSLIDPGIATSKKDAKAAEQAAKAAAEAARKQAEADRKAAEDAAKAAEQAARDQAKAAEEAAKAAEKAAREQTKIDSHAEQHMLQSGDSNVSTDSDGAGRKLG